MNWNLWNCKSFLLQVVFLRYFVIVTKSWPAQFWISVIQIRDVQLVHVEHVEHVLNSRQFSKLFICTGWMIPQNYSWTYQVRRQADTRGHEYSETNPMLGPVQWAQLQFCCLQHHVVCPPKMDSTLQIWKIRLHMVKHHVWITRIWIQICKNPKVLHSASERSLG